MFETKNYHPIFFLEKTPKWQILVSILRDTPGMTR